MSHLTTYKNDCLKNTNRERLVTALAELGIRLDYNTKHVKNQWIDEPVDAAFVKDGTLIPLGINFKKDNEGNEIVEVAGDPWGTGIDQKELTNSIAQIYQKHDIIAKCRSQRWFVDEQKDVKVNEDGDIVIQAARYV